MAKIKPFIDKEWHPEGGLWQFNCPGCGRTHIINTVEPNHNGAIWKFNGDVDKPTFMPSINEVLLMGAEETPTLRCHFFITNGRIDFCSDSFHELRNKIVDLNTI